MRKEFVMRGNTASGEQEVLNFSGFKPGLAYRMTEFSLYPSNNAGSATAELFATVTAAKTAESPDNPNFDNEGLIATAVFLLSGNTNPIGVNSVINDTFLITQNLIIAVIDTNPGSPMNVNWQCKFESVKMSGPEEAVTNYKQFAISDE